MYYVVLLLALVISTPIQDARTGRVIGYSRPQPNGRTLYSNRYNQRVFSTQNRNKSLIINGKYK